MLNRLGFFRRMTPLVVWEFPVRGLVRVCRNSARMLLRRAYAETARSRTAAALCARAVIGSTANPIAARQVSFFICRSYPATGVPFRFWARECCARSLQQQRGARRGA